MSSSVLYKILRVVAVIATSNTLYLSFANFQSDSKTELNKIIKSRNADRNSFNEFKSKKEQSFRHKKEQDKLHRRSLLRKQSLPKSFGIKKKGQAVFVSNELLQANIGSIQNILRGTKLSPSKKPNGSIIGYFIKSTGNEGSAEWAADLLEFADQAKSPHPLKLKARQNVYTSKEQNPGGSLNRTRLLTQNDIDGFEQFTVSPSIESENDIITMAQFT